MEIIKQSWEIIEQKNIFKHIELCGRVCYKSEDKITDTSAEQFVEMLIRNGHLAMLEHGTIYATELATKVNPDLLIYPYAYSIYRPPNKGWTINYRTWVEKKLECLLGDSIVEPTFHIPRVTVRFITSRAIANEFVRHRLFSFAQESTRFVNYNKKGLKFIEGEDFFKAKDGNWYPELIDFLEKSEKAYNLAIEYGFKPQRCRDLLPLCTKTEIVMTGTPFQWEQLFELRTAKNAHPDIQALTKPLQEEFRKRNLIS